MSKEHELLEQANFAYNTFVKLGPFYGKDLPDLPPTFRVSAEPIYLSKEYKEYFENIGACLGKLALYLRNLPNHCIELFNSDTIFRPPITFRVDVIIDENNLPHINEINTSDGADALMIAEQFAYLLSDLKDSSAAKIIESAKNTYKGIVDKNLVFIVENTNTNPYLSNFKRMKYFIMNANPELQVDIIDSKEICENNSLQPSMIYNTGYATPKQLHEAFGNNMPVISYGSYNAMNSKVVMALIHDNSLQDELSQFIGSKELCMLRTIIPKTKIISNESELINLLRDRLVIKGYRSSLGQSYLERGRSVFGPWLSDSEKALAIDYFRRGIQFIAQEYVHPRKFTVQLRKNGGRSLETKEGFNRICLKYVLIPNVNNDEYISILTASEATIGTNIVPTGRDCCFTAVDYK